jgi:plastocyanin
VSAVAVTLSDFEIVPDTLEVAAPEVGISVANSGITPHNLSVRDEAGVLVAATPTLSQGETAELQVELPGPGAYTIFCSLPGHESLGMSGRLVVASSASAEPTVASSASAEPTAAPS